MPRTKTGTGTDEELKVGTGRKPGRPKGSKNKPKEGTGGKLKRGTGKTGRVNKGYHVSETALMQRRTNLANLPARNDEEKEYNAKLISHVMKVHEISLHADKNDINSLRSCFAAYVQLCQEDGFKIGNIAAATSIGISHNLLYMWAKGSSGQEKQELAQFICSMCSTARETQITEGKLNPVIGIFHQRNFDGLRNDTEQQQNNQITDPDEETSNKYIEKYSHLIEE